MHEIYVFYSIMYPCLFLYFLGSSFPQYFLVTLTLQVELQLRIPSCALPRALQGNLNSKSNIKALKGQWFCLIYSFKIMLRDISMNLSGDNLEFYNFRHLGFCSS
eukprot:bmy_17215T0